LEYFNQFVDSLILCVGYFTVGLQSRPLDVVFLQLYLSDSTEVSISSQSLYFAPSNWDEIKTVNVIGQDDWVDDGDAPFTITLFPQSLDSKYNALNPIEVHGYNLDNDTAGFEIITHERIVSEAGLNTWFIIRLTSEPLYLVTIPIRSSNEFEGSLSHSQVKFNNSNWNIFQNVSIYGMNLYHENETY
jgi:hypothetical protein